MTSEALLLLLKLNIAASMAILGVMALRAAIRTRFGARIAYALWLSAPALMVAALLPAPVVEVAAATGRPTAISTATVIENWLAAPLGPETRLDPSLMLMAIWIGGMVLALATLIWRQAAFTRALGALRRDDAGVLRSGAMGVGPAIIGMFWPKIMLPSDFEAQFDLEERELVLAHERAHLAGRDPMINGLVAICQCLAWFNPLVHVAARLMRLDQELARDAAVLEQFPTARRRYAEAILKTQIAPMGLPLGCYWPPSEARQLKQRIAMLKQVSINKRKTAAGAVLVAMACMTSGCVIWAVQPARQVAAGIDAVTPAQARLNEKLLRSVLVGDAHAAEGAVASGADVNARTRDGMTALTITARKEDMRILSLLLEHGADLTLTSPGEGNALVAGAKRGHLFAVTALVEHGADVNAIPPGFGTPLAAAARAEQFEVVKYLVEHGADVNLASPLPAPWDLLWSGKHTPLEFAINSGDGRAIAYLKSKGAKM